MATERSKAPRRKRHLTGIRPFRSGGTWKWRARVRIAGVERVGPLRPSQELAHDDYLRLRAEIATAPPQIVTLAEGLEAVLHERMQMGTAGPLQLLALTKIREAILRAWAADSPLRSIDARELNWYVATVHQQGRSLTTIGQKDLPLLRAAFRLAGLQWPNGVRQVRAPRRVMAYFEPEEVVELVQRMRQERFLSPNGRVLSLPARERHADLVELMACTGLRQGEIERLRVGDVDLQNRSLLVVNAKSNRDADTVPLPRNLVGPLQRLIAGADGEGRLVPGGGTYLDGMFHAWKLRLKEPRLNGRALRHTYVSTVLADTGDLAVTQQRARHRSLTTTARYVHALRGRQARSVERIEERFLRGPAGAASLPADGWRPDAGSPATPRAPSA